MSVRGAGAGCGEVLSWSRISAHFSRESPILCFFYPNNFQPIVVKQALGYQINYLKDICCFKVNNQDLGNEGFSSFYEKSEITRTWCLCFRQHLSYINHCLLCHLLQLLSASSANCDSVLRSLDKELLEIESSLSSFQAHLEKEKKLLEQGEVTHNLCTTTRNCWLDVDWNNQETLLSRTMCTSGHVCTLFHFVPYISQQYLFDDHKIFNFWNVVIIILRMILTFFWYTYLF